MLKRLLCFYLTLFFLFKIYLGLAFGFNVNPSIYSPKYTDTNRLDAAEEQVETNETVPRTALPTPGVEYHPGAPYRNATPATS